jgi:hypothetical protein
VISNVLASLVSGSCTVMAGSLQVALEAAEATLAVCNSKVGKADVLDGAGKPREQARKDEIKVY